MEIVGTAYYENLKRCWRRRKYQRLGSGATNSKKKVKVARLGRIRRAPKLGLKLVSPIKLLAKFHSAYIDTMIRLTNTLGNATNNGFFREKKVAKPRHLAVLSCGDEVNSKLAFDIYKKLAASRETLDLKPFV